MTLRLQALHVDARVSFYLAQVSPVSLTAFSFFLFCRLPLQGMSHEQILGPETVLEGKTRETRKQQHTRRTL